MEENRKSRVTKRVTVVRSVVSAIPVRIVKDEFEEDRLQVGDEIVGWPRNGYSYPESVEYASLELSDGRSWNLPAETIPYDTYSFVSVTAVCRRTRRIDVLLGDDGISYVYVGDDLVGVAVPGFLYPYQVTTVRITCGNNSVEVADNDMQVIVHASIAAFSRRATVTHAKVSMWWLLGSGIDFDAAIGTEVGDEYPTSVRAGALSPNGPGMTFASAKAWSTGDTFLLEEEFAFWKQEDGSVTNGKITFPKERPFDQGWRKHRDIGFSVGVTLGNWQTMLDAIVGCYFDGVNTDTRIRARVERQKVLDHSRERIRKAVAGACFDPKTFDESKDVEVGIGERLLFIGVCGGKRVYAVDSPNHGHALYLFGAGSIKAARDWANGRIDWLEAKRLAMRRIVHVGEWKDRALAAIG